MKMKMNEFSENEWLKVEDSLKFKRNAFVYIMIGGTTSLTIPKLK